MDGKTIKKQIRWKKNSKNQSEIAHVNKKSLARKRIFVQTPFSHSAVKLE